jgi:hypothetical protein
VVEVVSVEVGVVGVDVGVVGVVISVTITWSPLVVVFALWVICLTG